MNKYQEALDVLEEYSVKYVMNKDTRDDFREVMYRGIDRVKSTLQELVDKATPKKPIIEGPFVREKDTFCPNCKINICLTPSSKPNFCWCCGQELDWSKDE